VRTWFGVWDYGHVPGQEIGQVIGHGSCYMHITCHIGGFMRRYAMGGRGK